MAQNNQEELDARAFNVMKTHYKYSYNNMPLTTDEKLKKAEDENALYADLFAAGRGEDVQMIVNHI